MNLESVKGGRVNENFIIGCALFKRKYFLYTTYEKQPFDRD